MNNPVISIRDNFFDNLDAFDLWNLEFEDFELGVDGVTYPHICTDLPKGMQYEFLYKLQEELKSQILPQYLFLRAMPEGCTAPSKIHSDRDMGAFTAHVYLSPLSHLASTSFLQHVDLGPLAQPHHTGAEWSQNPEEWKKYLTVYGAENRLLVHHAQYFHCAEPQEGFGTLRKDARLMLTCFFNVG